MACRGARKITMIIRPTTLVGKNCHPLNGCLALTPGMPSFSDRDLMMRYHWGMAVGHSHAHELPHGYAAGLESTFPQSPGETYEMDESSSDEADALQDAGELPNA